jgi:hypothetical protein
MSSRIKDRPTCWLKYLPHGTVPLRCSCRSFAERAAISRHLDDSEAFLAAEYRLMSMGEWTGPQASSPG